MIKLNWPISTVHLFVLRSFIMIENQCSVVLYQSFQPFDSLVILLIDYVPTKFLFSYSICLNTTVFLYLGTTCKRQGLMLFLKWHLRLLMV